MFYHEIETERLILKNISYQDRSFILKQFSNDRINEYLFDAEPVKTLEEADEIIAFYLQPEPRTQHRWILTLKSNNTKIGTCGFHCWDTSNHCVDIGYDLQEAYQGQGFMSEALTAILDFAKHEMMVKRVNAHIYIDNLKSIRLAERFGFTFLGETELCLFHNQHYLHKIYSLDIEVQIINNAIDYIKGLFSEDYSGHDYHHSIRVYNNAIRIAEKEGGNLLLIKLAALLHDVDDRKLFHTSENLENTRKFLHDNGVDEDTTNKICEIIKSVSYSVRGSIAPESIEGKIVQDADRLDALGAIGIARTFAYGGHKGRPIYDPSEQPIENMTAEEYKNHTSNSFNHFYEKILKLKNLINTETARSMAEKRHAFIENYLDEFISEWNGVR